MSEIAKLVAFDLGGTLLTSRARGLVQRVLRILQTKEFDPHRLVSILHAEAEKPLDAEAMILEECRLTRIERRRLREELRARQGSVRVRRGALDLMRAARQLAQKTVLVAGCSRWAGAPPPAILAEIDEYVTTWELGLPKRHPMFYDKLSHRLDVFSGPSCVMVGDSLVDDLAPCQALRWTTLNANQALSSISHTFRTWIETGIDFLHLPATASRGHEIAFQYPGLAALHLSSNKAEIPGVIDDGQTRASCMILPHRPDSRKGTVRITTNLHTSPILGRSGCLCYDRRFPPTHSEHRSND